MIGSLRMVGMKQIAKPGAQGRPALCAEGHKRIERLGGASLPSCRREGGQQTGLVAAPQVQNLLANGHPHGGLGSMENTKRQVLDREVATRSIG